MYCCLTIGVGLIILSVTEHIQNKLMAILVIYGNVPFFYYVLHFYIIRALSIVVFFAQGYGTNQIVNPKGPFLFIPPHFGFNLFGVYLVWLFVIASLYLPCRWFGKYKKTHNQWWLSYL